MKKKSKNPKNHVELFSKPIHRFDFVSLKAEEGVNGGVDLVPGEGIPAVAGGREAGHDALVVQQVAKAAFRSLKKKISVKRVGG